MPRLLLLLVVLLAAACVGDGEPNRQTTPTSAAPTTTSTPPLTTSPAPSSFEEVMVALSPDGSHLVDADGMSLYLFTLDDARTSTCTDACARTWPPLLGNPVAGEGVDPELLGNAERGNGSIQVTYGGQPLYTYTGDSQPGDAAGHGFNDVWFLVGPDGAAIDFP